MFKLILIFLMLLVAVNAHAATYYLATDGNDSTGDGSASNEWLTLQHAVGEMVKGDTLIVRNGTYTGASNVYNSANSMPTGSAWTTGNYTTIKAENDGMAIFDGNDARDMFYVGSLSGAQYWQFEGIMWCNPLGNSLLMMGISQVKLLRCGAYDAGDGNNVNFAIGQGCSYVLAENCYAYGSGRYKFLAYRADKIIFRNCVGRLDIVDAYSDHNEPISIYALYYATDCLVQNCIAIDSDQTAYYTNYDGPYGSFYAISNGSYPCNNNSFTNSVALNVAMGGFFVDTDVTNTTFSNCVAWDCAWSSSFSGVSNYIRGNASLINNCTMGGAQIASGYTYHILGDSNNSETITNSIILNFVNGYATRYINTKDYNSYYGNTDDDYDNSIGAHSITATNPLTASLLYLPRIEASSALDGAGESGADIGANAMTLIGTPGTLYGESGYATATATTMWPFPNEDLIYTKMKAYNEGGVSGDRGFCADEQTLTKYIWEYLGNTIPEEIYGGSPADETAPSTTSNLSASAGANAGEVALTWTAPGDDATTGTAASYDVRYSTSTINDGNWASATTATGEPTPSAAGTTENMSIASLNPGTTYYFALKTTDDNANVSGLSNVSSASAAVIPPQFRGVTFSGAKIQ